MVTLHRYVVSVFMYLCENAASRSNTDAIQNVDASTLATCGHAAVELQTTDDVQVVRLRVLGTGGVDLDLSLVNWFVIDQEKTNAKAHGYLGDLLEPCYHSRDPNFIHSWAWPPFWCLPHRQQTMKRWCLPSAQVRFPPHYQTFRNMQNPLDPLPYGQVLEGAAKINN
jgi:hypothetical protein